MNKSEYAKLLLDQRWDVVRRKILKRDEYQCRSCKAQNCRLNVHHKIYITGKMPWEIPEKQLVTLCDQCHSKAHEGRTIGEFIKGGTPGEQKYRKKRVNRSIGVNKPKVWVAGKGLIDR